MTCGQSSLTDQLLQICRQREKTDEIRDRSSIFTGSLSDLFRVQRQLLCQSRECLGSFDRVEVLTLDILDQRDFQEPIIRYFLDHNRDLG